MAVEPRSIPKPAPAAPELVFTHLDSLPTLAPIAVEVLRASWDERSEARDLVRLLRGDQSLSAKILSVANSAAMGARGEVGSLEKAVVLLGFNIVRNIVLAVKVFECFGAEPESDPPRHFDRVEFWKHALGVACAARQLAKRRPQLELEPEQAFLAGLLHDLGKVALDAVFPKSYERAVAQAELMRGDVSDHEQAVLGVDHTVAGRHLAEQWGLPGFLRDSIWLHHLSVDALPARVADPMLIAVVQLADTLVREQRIGCSGNFVFYRSSSALAENLDISEKAMRGCVESLVGEVAEFAGLLGLDRETPETLYLKSLTRANAELSRLNTELVTSNRRLAVSARYFEAFTRFDSRLSPQADLGATVAAIAEATCVALQQQSVAAFGVYERGAAIETYWITEEPQTRGGMTERVDDEFREWVAAETSGERVCGRAPLAVRRTLEGVIRRLGRGECWLLPIAHHDQLAGGILLLSDRDEASELSGERDELRSFLASLGLAIGRTNAHMATRRLSDNLAASNRRLQQVQVELLRARTLAMIVEMATGAGHELNSPLAVISGRAQLLRDRTDDAETRQALELIREKAHECSRIVDDLMDFARPPHPKPGVISLGDLLRTARDTWLEQSQLPASRLLLAIPEPGSAEAILPKLKADREQILTVLNELLRNATDAISSNEGTITVEWRTSKTDEKQWVEIEVRDTGCGMTPDVLQRAFDPFFSHRAAGRGRGIGLARAYRIVEAHGGRIWLESQPERGTIARLTLSRAPEK